MFGCLFNSMEIHCSCHQLQSRSCALFGEILLESMEVGQWVTPDSRFLYTGTVSLVSFLVLFGPIVGATNSNTWYFYSLANTNTGEERVTQHVFVHHTLLETNHRYIYSSILCSKQTIPVSQYAVSTIML